MTNSNFLKKLLTTASVIAVSASAGSAFAELKRIDANATIINAAPSAGIFDTATPPVAAKFNNDDSLAYFGNFTLTTGGDVDIGAIDLNNNTAGTFTTKNDVSLSAVINSTGAQKLAITIGDNKNLTLNSKGGLDAEAQPGNDVRFTHLGDVTLGEGAGGSKLVINTDTTLSNNILDDGTKNSMIEGAENAQINGERNWG